MFALPAMAVLSGTIPSELGRMRAVQYLLLQETQLSGTLPTQLGRLDWHNHGWVFVDQTHLSGTLPTELGLLVHTIPRTQCTTPTPCTFPRCTADAVHRVWRRSTRSGCVRGAPPSRARCRRSSGGWPASVSGSR